MGIEQVSAKAYPGSLYQREHKSPSFDYDCRELIEGLPAAIYTCDLEGKITFYNQAAAELWGREPEIGKDLWCGSWKIYKPDGSLLPLDKCPMAITLKEGRAVKGEEIVIERPDGGRVTVLPHPKPIFDDMGNITGAINMLVDITSKKAAEQRINDSEKKYRLLSQSLEAIVEERTATLKSSEERYHKMIDEVQDYAILLLDKDGFIRNWNKGAEKIKGYSEKEIIGKNFRIFYQDEDRKEQLPERLIAEATEKGKAMHEGWRLRKNGSRFWGSIVITALHDEQGNIIGFSKVTRDLTEKKLAEDQIKQYSKDLESQNKELAQYAHVTSHDLQEPLRKIQTFINLVERNIDDKEAVLKNLGKINSSARRMEVLIKDVLKYSELTHTDEIMCETDLNKVVEDIIDDYDVLVEQKRAKIAYSGLPVIKAIPVQMHQLFSNLISNSIKFSSENPLIEIFSEKIINGEKKKYLHLDSNVDYTKITFKDNGIGFEQHYAGQIFNLFQRLDYNKPGTGIGLAICKKIVENHKGQITVDSEPNKGTTFSILLPVA